MIFSYYIVGLPSGAVFAFHLGWGARGVVTGLLLGKLTHFCTLAVLGACTCDSNPHPCPLESADAIPTGALSRAMVSQCSVLTGGIRSARQRIASQRSRRIPRATWSPHHARPEFPRAPPSSPVRLLWSSRSQRRMPCLLAPKRRYRHQRHRRTRAPHTCCAQKSEPPGTASLTTLSCWMNSLSVFRYDMSAASATAHASRLIISQSTLIGHIRLFAVMLYCLVRYPNLNTVFIFILIDIVITVRYG